MPYLPCLELEPKTSANATVIWLHGLGADGNDFAPIVPALNLPASMSVRFVFPHAPSIPVTINGGMVMPAWYDILSMDIDRKIDVQQILVSSAAVIDLIEREIERGIDSSRIIIAGFSQGGAVAYHAALSYSKPLAGLMALSTYFATSESIVYTETNKQISILICHGKDDPVVPVVLGDRANEKLKTDNFNVSYKTYPMQHEVCHTQIQDISAWIQTLLGIRLA